MRILYLIGLMSFAIFNATAQAAAKIEHWQTAQGSRVYYVHTDGLPLVDIQVVFDAGSARDGQQFGLASLTNSMLNTGAGDWNADDIAQRFESVGAIFSASSAIDTASVSLRTLTEPALFDKALDIMRVILSQPRFNDADFQREKNRTLAALKQQEESPADTTSIAFYKTLYGDHPYGHDSSGTLATVGALKLSDLPSFYSKYYVAANAMIVIVGDLSKSQAQHAAETLLGGLAVGEKPAALPEVTALATASTQHIDFPSTQTHVVVGTVGINRQDPDYFDLYVGNHILGGSGLVSKLFNEVREKRGLAYSAGSAFVPLLKRGPFQVSLQTRNDQTQQALQVLNATLGDFIQNGISETELTAAKQNIIGGFAMRFDTNKELANYVAMIGFNDLPLDYLDNFQAKIAKVSVASIKAAFQRHVKVNALQTIMVGKK